jgi:hypothetical protein
LKERANSPEVAWTILCDLAVAMDRQRCDLAVAIDRQRCERDRRVADRIKAVRLRDDGMIYGEIARVLF